MSRFTPDRLRAEADAVEEDRHIWRSVGRMLAAMLRQAAEDAEEVARLRDELAKTASEARFNGEACDEARAIAQRWHDDARDIASSSTQVEYKLRHKADAATIAGWSKDNAPAVAKPSTEGAE